MPLKRRRGVLPLVLGLLLGMVGGTAASCGTDRGSLECYGTAEGPAYDPESGMVWICDEPTPLPRKYPQFEDTELLMVRLEGQDECPMCPWELDQLFWQAFLEQVDDRGLAEGEDPDCIRQGHAIEIACLVQPLHDGKCAYHAVVASHCTLGPVQSPVQPPP